MRILDNPTKLNAFKFLACFLALLLTLFLRSPQTVCQGMIVSVGKQFFRVLAEGGGRISANDICGLVREGACARYSKRINGWALSIPDLGRRADTRRGYGNWLDDITMLGRRSSGVLCMLRLIGLILGPFNTV